MTVSQPTVVTRVVDGEKQEPYEEVGGIDILTMGSGIREQFILVWQHESLP